MTKLYQIIIKNASPNAPAPQEYSDPLFDNYSWRQRPIVAVKPKMLFPKRF